MEQATETSPTYPKTLAGREHLQGGGICHIWKSQDDHGHIKAKISLVRSVSESSLQCATSRVGNQKTRSTRGRRWYSSLGHREHAHDLEAYCSSRYWRRYHKTLRSSPGEISIRANNYRFARENNAVTWGKRQFKGGGSRMPDMLTHAYFDPQIDSAKTYSPVSEHLQ